MFVSTTSGKYMPMPPFRTAAERQVFRKSIGRLINQRGAELFFRFKSDKLPAIVASADLAAQNLAIVLNGTDTWEELNDVRKYVGILGRAIADEFPSMEDIIYGTPTIETTSSPDGHATIRFIWEKKAPKVDV